MEIAAGAVAFVTGGAGGIGRGIAEALAEQGARIALADRDEAELAVAVHEMSSAGAEVIAVPFDVTDRDSWTQASNSVHESLGPVQVLVNNAGVSTLGVPFDEVAPTVWDRVVAINLTAVYDGIRTFLDDLIRTHGYIVNTASAGGLAGAPLLAPYSATKAAIIALSESLNAELAEAGVGVSALCPGGVRSRLWRTSRAIRGLPDVDAPPDDLSGQSATAAMLPIEVGRRVVNGIRHADLYIMTHPGLRAITDQRSERINAGWDSAARFAAST